MRSQRHAVAVHILVALTLRKERLSSDDLAWSIGTNPSLVRRIVSQLARAGLVASHPGAAGGVELARDPKSIDLLEILEAVELKPVRDVHTANLECPLGAVIEDPLRTVFDEADRAAEDVLRLRTLHSVARMAGRRIAASRHGRTASGKRGSEAGGP